MNNTDQNGWYQIRVRGHLGEHWADRINGMTITLTPEGETIIAGVVADQAALHGLLRTIRDSGMELLSVNPINHDEQ